MADRFSGIGNIPPAYPVKPVEPSGKDRPSGERKRKPPQRRKPSPDEDDSSDNTYDKSRDRTSGESTTRKIDEYI